MIFNDECLIIEDMDQNWDKDTTSKNREMRRRSFLNCKNVIYYLDAIVIIKLVIEKHFNFVPKKQLLLMEVAKPSIEHAHYNFVASCYLSMSQAMSDSLYNFSKESFRSGCSAFINSNPSIKRNYVIPKPEDFCKPIQRTYFHHTKKIFVFLFTSIPPPVTINYNCLTFIIEHFFKLGSSLMWRMAITVELQIFYLLQQSLFINF